MEKETALTRTAHQSPTRTGSIRRKMKALRRTRMPQDSIRQLQQIGGNRAVQRLFESGVIRAKLTIGPANDIYEQEADRVADQVMKAEVRSQEPGVRRENDIIQMKAG